MQSCWTQVTSKSAELIDRRSRRAVGCPPGGTLGDYVPFYFTPSSPMLYNISSGYSGIRQRSNEEIVVLVSSLPKLLEMKVPFLFTDRHALLAAAQFHAELRALEQLDWAILQARDFRRDSEDVGKLERYQAEALAYKHVPVAALLGAGCYDEATAAHVKSHAAKLGLSLQVVVRRGWYFT
jgi:hypothetical protein